MKTLVWGKNKLYISGATCSHFFCNKSKIILWETVQLDWNILVCGHVTKHRLLSESILVHPIVCQLSFCRIAWLSISWIFWNGYKLQNQLNSYLQEGASNPILHIMHEVGFSQNNVHIWNYTGNAILFNCKLFLLSKLFPAEIQKQRIIITRIVLLWNAYFRCYYNSCQKYFYQEQQLSPSTWKCYKVGIFTDNT